MVLNLKVSNYFEMSAVIRVKRLLDADPVDTIVLNYKKRKIDDSSNEEAAERQPTVLKLAGTLNSQVISNVNSYSLPISSKK